MKVDSTRIILERYAEKYSSTDLDEFANFMTKNRRNRNRSYWVKQIKKYRDEVKEVLNNGS